MDLPNVTLTREEFPVGDENLLKEKRIRARVSCLLDIHSKHILTAKIVETTINEVDLAIEHLENLKQRLNITKLITIYDRGYPSIELMAKTIDLNSKFLIRLPKNVFRHLIKQMKTNDEIIKINLTNNRLSHFDDENLKEKARKMGRLEIRIALVDIGKNEPEILATNLTSEEFSTEDLKELYGKRWSVETGFDRLKNLIEIEDFSGIRRTIIEQDFHAHIFVYNLAMTIKNHAENNITRIPRNKDEKIIYQSNFAKITGNIYLFLFDLIFETQTKREQIIDFIVKEASKELIQYKENQYNNKERKTPGCL
ncbi:transposase [Methanobrevibacter sp. V74]|uniref:transposase n=1 Tax=Methanobrevibacter sp. V74 TaxID=3064279 RepID=UPI002733B9A9|nr:transposase [Methanobrevibacter sp. V74]